MDRPATPGSDDSVASMDSIPPLDGHSQESAAINSLRLECLRLNAAIKKLEYQTSDIGRLDTAVKRLESQMLDLSVLTSTLKKLESQTSELSLLNVIDKKLESQSSDLGSLNTAIKELQSQMSGLTKVTEEQKKFEKATDITLTGDDTPWPGNIYIISDKDTSQVLTYKHPRPIFTTFKPGLSSQQWVCHENNGWIGFASDAGPTLAFLGHRDDWKIACEAPHFRGWECYVARKRPDGGYQLLMNDDPHLRPMGRDDDGALRVIRSGNTDAWWGFTKI